MNRIGALASLAAAVVALAAPTAAADDTPAPSTTAAPPPYAPYGQPGASPYPPPAYGGSPPQSYPPEGYPSSSSSSSLPPGLGYPGAYPPPGPPPPPPPKESGCCRWSARIDPFELIFRRLTFQGELKLVGPLTLEVTPSWIFGSAYQNIDEKGYVLGGNLALYFLSWKALNSMWVKFHATYENYTATLTNPYLTRSSVSRHLSSAILGGMIGTTNVFGRDGGFALSGGIGVGVATASTVTLTAPGDPANNIAGFSATLYDKLDKIRLLGSLGIGVAF